MVDSLKRWFSSQVDLASLGSGSSIYCFAFHVASGAVILALVSSLLVISTLEVFGWLPWPLSEAIAFGVGLSWLVCGPVCGVIALVAGHAVGDLAESRAEFKRLSRTDMLSGLLNRRAFSEYLQEIDDQASLVIFDLDRFKTINDRHGHTAGDAVIRHVASVIVEVFGGGHPVARLGGEEFGVIVGGDDGAQRREMVERARRMIASRPIVFEGEQITTSISAGIADILPGRRKQMVYKAADKALYLAKAAGRNRVVHEDEGRTHFDESAEAAAACEDVSFSAVEAVEIAVVEPPMRGAASS